MILTCRGTRRGLVRARCSRILLLKVRWLYANAIVRDTKSSTDDLREAVATLTSVEASWRRIFGPSHPETTIVEGALEDAQEALAAREAPPGSA